MMTVDKAELRRLAEAAKRAYEEDEEDESGWLSAAELHMFHGLGSDESDFIEEASPAAVLSLLDDCDKAEAERDAALAELSELREELAGVKSVGIETAKAMKRLVMHARTSGGTAGPDDGMMDACEQAERMLSIGGMGRAYMEGADAAMAHAKENGDD